MGMESSGGMSVADVMALQDRDNGGFGGNGSWVFFLFFLLAWGGGGFGFGNGGERMATSADVQRGFDNQAVISKLNGLESGLCDGFYAANTGMMQGFNNIGMQLAENRFASQQCCCETNRNIDAVRYENAKNTCDIVTAIKEDGAATRALINANTMQELRDQLQSAQLQLSQQAQTSNLISELRPCARPAYITCSPYTSVPYNQCGCSGC